MARRYGWTQGECDYCGKERSVETVYPWGTEDEGMARCFVCAKEHERGRQWDSRRKAYVEVEPEEYAPNAGDQERYRIVVMTGRGAFRGPKQPSWRYAPPDRVDYVLLRVAESLGYNPTEVFIEHGRRVIHAEDRHGHEVAQAVLEQE